MQDPNQQVSRNRRQTDNQKVDIRDRVDENNIDLSDAESLEKLKDQLLRQPVFLQEKHRGTIGKMLVFAVACWMVPLPLVGGLIAAFGSPEQAQAYTSTVIPLVKVVAQYCWVPLLPIIAYYFYSGRAKK